jgi:hypothetical protein
MRPGESQEAFIKRLVEAAPALSAEQRAQLRVLLATPSMPDGGYVDMSAVDVKWKRA